MPIIIRQPVFPPIPTTKFDWCAYYDGQEELRNYGWGPTEAEAVADLQEKSEDQFFDPYDKSDKEKAEYIHRHLKE